MVTVKDGFTLGAELTVNVRFSDPVNRQYASGDGWQTVFRLPSCPSEEAWSEFVLACIQRVSLDQ